MGKQKRNDAQARARRAKKQQERKQRRAERAAPGGVEARGEPDEFVGRDAGRRAGALDLPPYETSALGAVPGAERCQAPIYLTPRMQPTADPLATLGLDPARRPTRAEIEAAYRTALAAHPPEREPEAARDILDARERLTRPSRILERELGVLYVPDPRRYDLPCEAPPKPKPEPAKRKASPAPAALAADEPEGALAPSRPRLLASLALYALVEDELEYGGLEHGA